MKENPIGTEQEMYGNRCHKGGEVKSKEIEGGGRNGHVNRENRVFQSPVDRNRR